MESHWLVPSTGLRSALWLMMCGYSYHSGQRCLCVKLIAVFSKCTIHFQPYFCLHLS